MKNPAQIRVLAIASAGGHWVQLRRLRPAWDGCQTIYVSTSESRRNEVINVAREEGTALPSFHGVIEASRWDKFKLLKQLLQVTKILLKERPDIVISTGAAPGFFALKIGKLLGARTIWIDSIANTEELSLSGKKAGGCADLWLTQWKHLAASGSNQKQPRYKGSVI